MVVCVYVCVCGTCIYPPTPMVVCVYVCVCGIHVYRYQYDSEKLQELIAQLDRMSFETGSHKKTKKGKVHKCTYIHTQLIQLMPCLCCLSVLLTSYTLNVTLEHNTTSYDTCTYILYYNLICFVMKPLSYFFLQYNNCIFVPILEYSSSSSTEDIVVW